MSIGEPRVAFVGTCQVAGMAAAARRMLPTATVVSYQIGAPHDEATIAAAVAGFDLVVTQIADQAAPLSVTGLAGQVGLAMELPPVVFTGFHPDMIYLSGHDGPLFGAWDFYHSRIAVAGFLAGLDETRTIRLFNAHVYAELDYFDTYPVAVQRLTATFAAHGFDIGRVLGRLVRRGFVFMHTINHPAMPLIAHLTKLALLRAGLVDAAAGVRIDTPDPLADGAAGAVLPPLAARLGLTGSETYRRSVSQAGAAPRDVTLGEYVEQSFRVYRSADPMRLRAPIVLRTVKTLRTLLA